jgi:hypothetical protein
MSMSLTNKYNKLPIAVHIGLNTGSGEEYVCMSAFTMLSVIWEKKKQEKMLHRDIDVIR